MVLVRFEAEKILKFSALAKEDLLEVPWLLGGEARQEDDTIVMEFNPDRPDLYSIQGIVRAIRTFRGIEKYSPLKVVDMEGLVEIEPPPERPYFSVGIVKDCQVEGFIEEIIDFQEKLHKTIGRNRKAVAIGLHDLSKVEFPITYRGVSREHTFKPLGESDSIELHQFMESNSKAIEFGGLVGENIPAIIDQNGEIISLPPILNSSITTVTEVTKDLLVDVTGTSESLVQKTIMLMLTSLSYSGGSIGTVMIKGTRVPRIVYQKKKIRNDLLRKMIGYNLPKESIIESIARMGYGIENDGLIVPPYRVDVMGDIDVVEDILKGVGYEKIARRSEGFVSYGKADGLRTVENKLRNLLVGYGLSETMSSVLINKRFGSIYSFRDTGADVINPASQEQDSIRTRLSPSLMETFRNNFRNPYPQRIFEIGTVFLDGKEKDVLGIGTASRDASFSEIKGVFIGILEDLGIENYEIVRDEVEMYIQGRVGGIVVESKKIGFFGEVHPKILKDLGMKMPIAMGELVISEVIQ